MKTIAVLTDLSKGAEHTAQFALHFAKKMKAQVLLFQVAEVPAAPRLVLAGEQENMYNEDAALEDFAGRMRQLAAARAFDPASVPAVHTHEDSTELVDIMTTIMQNEAICLVVTDPGNERDLASYLQSDVCNRIVDWARVPVLVVPACAPLRNPEKIAYASRLHEEDINAIAELGALLECFAAELMVAHLNEKPADQAIRQVEDQLNRDLYKKLNCGGVYFRSIPDTDTEKNWNWLRANKRTEMLAVMQQPRNIMDEFFSRGQNQAVTYHLTIPVMILPKRP